MTAPAAMPSGELTARLASLGTSADKGEALQEFCALFFGAIPGVIVAEQKQFDDEHSQEVDLLLENDKVHGGLDMLKSLVFVESKNWAKPVGSAEVAWFDWKIRRAGRGTDGILVVVNGVTGRKPDRRAAWQILEMANSRKRRILVLSAKEMADCKTAEDVRQLIKLKKRRLVLGKAPLSENENRSV